MNKPTILFLIETPFTLRDYNRFGIDYFLGQGYPVQILDCSPMLHPEALSVASLIPVCDSHHFIKTKRDFSSCLERIGGATAIVQLTYGLVSLSLYKRLQKNKIPVCMYVGSSPFSALPMNLRRKKFSYLCNPKRIANRLFRMAPHRWFGLHDAELLMVRGGELLGRPQPCGPATNVCYANSFDHDLLLTWKKSGQKIENKNIAVFLDQYVPYHRDNAICGVRPIDPESYYNGLNKFFSFLEESTGLQIVIAGHPRFDYDSIANAFFGRDVVQGKTIELVCASKLVVLHDSTAVNFAIMMQKPLMFVVNSELYSRDRATMDLMAAQFCKKIYNVDNEPWDIRDAFSIRLDLYAAYAAKYIRNPEKFDKFSWEIILNELEINFIHD